MREEREREREGRGGRESGEGRSREREMVERVTSVTVSPNERNLKIIREEVVERLSETHS